MSSVSSSTGAAASAANSQAYDELRVFYYLGSSITLVASLFVIFSYMKFRACRQHPSSLVFWRSLSDVLFSLQFIILFSMSEGRLHCNVFSFLFQFSVLASQSWYFMNAVDLLRSMRNPFSTPASSIPIYHVYVWTMSLVTSVAIDASHHDYFREDMQLCWTSTTSTTLFNYLNWLTFFVPTLFYYFFSIGTMIYAGVRLKQGLQETFATRQHVLSNGVRYVGGFCAYWTFAGIIYGLIILRSQNKLNSAPSEDGSLPLYATFAVTIAFRGVVDVFIWVYNQKVLSIYRRWWNGEPHDDYFDLGTGDIDINRALRREVLIFSTTGIGLATERANNVPFTEMKPTVELYPQSLDSSDPRNMHSIVRIDVLREDFSEYDKLAFLPSPTTNAPALATPLMNETPSDSSQSGGSIVARPDGVPFLDYAPQVFRYLRFQYGIDEGAYTRSIQGKTDAMIEKFTEGGRSGSFFYFSEDGQYIVKTLTETEASFLVRFLPRYTEYMSKNRNTLISRFCGFHSLRLYNLTIRFMVMQSVFQTKRKIHERYDLKGSFVDRHADTGGGVKKNRASFASGLRVGGFKNVVYKDNDLNRTVRLSEEDRLHFLHQVRKDAFFLRDCNIMDYSLLLGVHHTSHLVPLMTPPGSLNNSFSLHRESPAPSVAPASRPSLARTASQLPPATTNQLFTKDDGGLQASIIEGPGIYFFGLIDILQEYNTSKKLERFAKKYLRLKDGDGISSMPPSPYADRFVRFMSNMTREEDESVVAALRATRSISSSPPPEGDADVEMDAGEALLDGESKPRTFAGGSTSSRSDSNASRYLSTSRTGSIGSVASSSRPHGNSAFLSPSSLSSHAYSGQASSEPVHGSSRRGFHGLTHAQSDRVQPMGINDRPLMGAPGWSSF